MKDKFGFSDEDDDEEDLLEQYGKGKKKSVKN